MHRKRTYDSIGDLQHLFEQRVFLFVPTTRVNDDDLKAFRLEFFNAIGGDHNRVSLRIAARK